MASGRQRTLYLSHTHTLFLSHTYTATVQHTYHVLSLNAGDLRDCMGPGSNYGVRGTDEVLSRQ